MGLPLGRSFPAPRQALPLSCCSTDGVLGAVGGVFGLGPSWAWLLPKLPWHPAPRGQKRAVAKTRGGPLVPAAAAGVCLILRREEAESVQGGGRGCPKVNLLPVPCLCFQTCCKAAKNALESLPDTFAVFWKNHLKEVDFSDNLLKEVPPCFFQLEVSREDPIIAPLPFPR